MKTQIIEVSAFLQADTKEQAHLVSRYAKAEYFMHVHEAVVSGEYRSWKNATLIVENTCGNENYYLKRFYAQMDGFIRVATENKMLNRVPVTGAHKRALFAEAKSMFEALAKKAN